MANEFASTLNSPGLLKNEYDSGDTLGDALKRKREALLATKGMSSPKDEIEDNAKSIPKGKSI